MSRAMLRRFERSFLGMGPAGFVGQAGGALTARDAAEDELECKREHLAAELVKIVAEVGAGMTPDDWPGIAEQANRTARVVYPDLPAAPPDAPPI